MDLPANNCKKMIILRKKGLTVKTVDILKWI